MKTNSEIQTNIPKVFNSKIAEKALSKFLTNMSVQSAIIDLEVMLVALMESNDYTSKESLSFLWTIKSVKKLLNSLDESFDIKTYYALRRAQTNSQ